MDGGADTTQCDADGAVMRTADLGAQRRFDELWQACAPRVQAYALRHCGPDGADDVVAETFLVAWRRLPDVPEPPLPWLLVVARNTVLNQRRTRTRMRLDDAGEEWFATVADGGSGPEVTATERAAALAALAGLSATEREALLLVAWDGLSAAEAAEVADCTPTAFRVRLHRARSRFSVLFDHEGDQS